MGIAQLIKPFPCLTQLGIKFILLINVKMPTLVCILTFMSRINTTQSKESIIFNYLVFYEQMKFHAQFS